MDAARRRTGEGRGNRYHQHVDQDDDVVVDDKYDNHVVHDDGVVAVDHEFNSLDCVLVTVKLVNVL